MTNQKGHDMHMPVLSSQKTLGHHFSKPGSYDLKNIVTEV